MRIIIKPLGMVAIAVLIGGTFAAVTLRKPVGSDSSRTHVGNLIVGSKWKFYTEKGALGQLDEFQASIAGSNQPALRVTVSQMGEQPWNIGLSQPLGAGFKAGEKLQLRFWGRSAEGAQIAVMIQRNVPGFPHCFNETIPLGADWKEFRFDVTTTTMAKWESMIAVHSGFKVGAVELAGVELTHS